MSPLKKRDGDHVFFDDSMAVEVLNKKAQDFDTPSKYSVKSDDILPVDMFPDEASAASDFGSQATGERYGTGREADEQSERDIFDKARHYLNPGPFLRYIIYLYGERKLLTFFCVHFMCTMVIWGELSTPCRSR